MNFDCLAFFKEELKSNGARTRIDAISRVTLIANALGPVKSINELLPFLTTLIQDERVSEDEECLFHLARQFGQLSDYINGRDELITPTLEQIATQEETVVRDEAVQSLRTIAARQPQLVPEHLVPIQHRLATKSDFFTARVSACWLLPTVYKYADEEQKPGLRTVYTTLCADDTPMVRRAAANSMKDLMAVCAKQDILADLVGVYKTLAQDDTQDSIRVACVLATIVMAKSFGDEENRQHTVQVIKDGAEDRSWRVRLTIAKNFHHLVTAYGPEMTQSFLMPSFMELMKDAEQEVRKEALTVIEPWLALSSPLTSEQLQARVLPQFQSLVVDPAQPVRAALALVLGPVAKVVGQDITQQRLLNFICDLMKDEFHDVRLNIVSHAGLICEVLSADGAVQTLLHTIQNLVMDNNWRIRKSVVEQVPKLARIFGVEMFEKMLEALFLPSLRDSVHSVRQAAIHHLKEIADTFGSQWTVDRLLPKLVEQYSQSAGYANRVTTIHVVPRVSGVMSADQIAQSIVPLLLRAAKDVVPNVRFSACRTILWMIENKKLSTSATNQSIKPVLAELEADGDGDVRYFAQRALAVCP